jgi:uncharacterized protein (TIGR02266 family)
VSLFLPIQGSVPASSAALQEAIMVQAVARPAERRQYPRAQLKAEVHLGSTSNFYTGFMNDISEGGLFVATHQLLPHGSLIDLEFSLPDEGGAICVQGLVRWVCEYNPTSDGHPGMGVQFTNLQERDRLRIERFVEVRGTLFYED